MHPLPPGAARPPRPEGEAHKGDFPAAAPTPPVPANRFVTEASGDGVVPPPHGSTVLERGLLYLKAWMCRLAGGETWEVDSPLE